MASRIGLALSGGGAKGAFTVGALKVIRQRLDDSPFPVISGTSTGSLIGTLLTVNDWTTLVDIYSKVQTENVVNPHHALVASIAGPEAVLFAAAVLGGRAIYDTSALKATIQANVDFNIVKSHASKTLLIYNAVDLQTGEVVAFNNRDHSATMLLNALLASASMPVLMDPVDITLGGETHQYVDGGVREFLPLGAVFDSGIELDLIIGISTAPLTAKKRPASYEKIIEILGRTVDLLDTEIGANDYYGAQQFNAMLQMLKNAAEAGVNGNQLLRGIPSDVRSRMKDKRPVPLVLIAPKNHLDLDSLDFDSEQMRALMKLGVTAGKEALDTLEL
jgi:NTE family protein